MRLKDYLPDEFLMGEYDNTRAYKLKEVDVLEKVDGTYPGYGWPGREKHVLWWYVLTDGHIVGFNENPSRGWSFPVRRQKKA